MEGQHHPSLQRWPADPPHGKQQPRHLQLRCRAANITSEKDLAKGKGGIDHWFNTDAVTYASSGNSLAIGNAPRYIGSVRYVITKDTDLALEKNFAIYHEATFKFRAEAYNLSNTASAFDVPDVNLGDTNFGQVTSTKSVGPRTIQFGTRIEF